MDALLNFLHTFASFVLVLTVIVFVHEFGHYLIARLCGVRVTMFSIGFGRELFGVNDRHGTRWKFSLLPLGGYVKMFGDASEASTPDGDKLAAMSEDEKKVAFHFKPLWQKAAVVFGGPLFNFLFAIGVLAYFFVVIGQPRTPAEVGAVAPNSAAERAGLQPGDVFLEIDGTQTEYFDDIQRMVRPNPGKDLNVILVRQGKTLEIVLRPDLQETQDMFGDPVKIGLLGVKTANVRYEKLGPLPAVGAAVGETWKISVDTMRALGQMVCGERSVKELGGPIRIAEYSGKSTEQGARTVLWLMALLSINLGLINLFPIPLLDGGHLLFYAIEGMRGRPLAEKVQDYAFRLGLALVVTLMVFTTVNDLIRLDLF